MVKKYKAAAAIILAAVLTACGQQEQESKKAESVQIQFVEETGGQETGTQTTGEQANDGLRAESDSDESGRETNAGTDGRMKEPDMGETAGEEQEELKTDNNPAEEETADAAEETAKIQDSEEKSSILYGTWQVVDYKTCQIYAMSQQEIEEVLTYKVAYYEDGVSLNGQQVRLENFGYTFVDYAQAELSQDFNVDLTEWWNGSMSVSMGQILSDEGFFGDTFFPADADHLWIYYNGVFFRAEKTKE